MSKMVCKVINKTLEECPRCLHRVPHQIKSECDEMCGNSELKVPCVTFDPIKEADKVLNE